MSVIQESFGSLLKKLIKDAEMSQYDFYTAAGIKKPYFYDIISGKSNPPPYHLQQKFVEVLKADEDTKKKLYDLAAEERDEFPADIAQYVKVHPECLDEIRKTIGLTSGRKI